MVKVRRRRIGMSSFVERGESMLKTIMMMMLHASFMDAERGQGTHAISRAVYHGVGRHVNERRRRRGLNDRPLRVGIIGFPMLTRLAQFVVLCF
jgi:hypothetical protein